MRSHVFRKYLREKIEKKPIVKPFLPVYMGPGRVFLTIEKGLKSRDTFPLGVFLLTKVFLFYFHTLNN